MLFSANDEHSSKVSEKKRPFVNEHLLKKLRYEITRTNTNHQDKIKEKKKNFQSIKIFFKMKKIR